MRDNKIDLLRFLGLSLIILAHINPPVWLFQLRNFDVPLMVLVSGLAFTKSRKSESYLSYLWKRIKRLVFPTWLFLTFYFLFMSVVIKKNDFTFQDILDSYTLVEGIGYVWVIRIFLLVALFSPFIARLNSQIKTNRNYFFILISIYLGYEILLFLPVPSTNSFFGNFLFIWGYHSIVFSLIFAFGIRLPQISKNKGTIIFLALTSIFTVMAVNHYQNQGLFVPTQAYKYPPSLYYLSYALSMSILSWLLIDKVANSIKKIPKIESSILFIAQNSFWIYLWHILFIKLFEYYYPSFQGIIKSVSVYFPVRYITIYLVSIAIAGIQIYLVNRILIPAISQDSVKKNLKILLTG